MKKKKETRHANKLIEDEWDNVIDKLDGEFKESRNIKSKVLDKTILSNGFPYFWDKKTTMEHTNELINWSDFSKIEIRTGTIISAEVFKEARNPAYKLKIDFGDFGIRKTSAQLTKLYSPDEIVGKQVVAVVNFPPKQIANMQSECLVLGAVDGDEVTLLTTDKSVKNGLRIG